MNGCLGVVIPPNAQGEMKIFRDTSFTNTIRHSSGQDISVPPDLPDYGQWDVSQTMKNEVAATARGFFGAQAGDFDMQDHRICWYGSIRYSAM